MIRLLPFRKPANLYRTWLPVLMCVILILVGLKWEVAIVPRKGTGLCLDRALLAIFWEPNPATDSVEVGVHVRDSNLDRYWWSMWIRTHLASVGFICIPLWMPTVAWIALGQIWHRRRLRRLDPDACSACGYSVKDLPRCPECGTLIPRASA